MHAQAKCLSAPREFPPRWARGSLFQLPPQTDQGMPPVQCPPSREIDFSLFPAAKDSTLCSGTTEKGPISGKLAGNQERQEENSISRMLVLSQREAPSPCAQNVSEPKAPGTAAPSEQGCPRVEGPCQLQGRPTSPSNTLAPPCRRAEQWRWAEVLLTAKTPGPPGGAPNQGTPQMVNRNRFVLPRMQSIAPSKAGRGPTNSNSSLAGFHCSLLSHSHLANPTDTGSPLIN